MLSRGNDLPPSNLPSRPRPDWPGRRIIALEKDPHKAAFARDQVAAVTVEDRNILRAGFLPVDGVTITDLLHQLGSFAEQEGILDAAHRILPRGGQLIVKEVTQSRPVRDRLTLALDRVAFPHDRLFFRRNEELAGFLDTMGFTGEFRPLWAWTPYRSNVHVCTER